jgi:hypothetical protein
MRLLASQAGPYRSVKITLPWRRQSCTGACVFASGEVKQSKLNRKADEQDFASKVRIS